MKIAFHGGKCCGIKHISDLGSYPEDKIGQLKPRKLKEPEWTHDRQLNPDQWGLDVSSEINCYPHEAPKETYLERLDRYLAFLADWRPEGITEIVLCNYAAQGFTDQVEPWEDLLKERGFKLVNDCLNSNTGNRIFVYHLNKEGEE